MAADCIRFDPRLMMWCRISGERIEPLTAAAARAELADPAYQRRLRVAWARSVLSARPPVPGGPRR